MKQEANKRFIEGVETLKRKGVSFVAMARAIGIPKQKVIDIRHGRSSADEGLLAKLFLAYPEIIREGEDVPSSNEKLQSEIEAQDAELEKLSREVAELEQLLEKANTDREDIQRELKRAMAIIEKQANTIDALLKKKGVID